MPKEMMYGEAMAAAIVEEMQCDSNVVFYGQNMAMTERDPMLKMFGRNRVRLAPISETAEIGMAVGAAVTGLRPIVELWMSEFMLVAMDQVLNEAPRLRYMSGGQVKVPLVLKAGYGFAAGWGGQHSNCLYHTMMGIPGLKVALPSTPADAKGLMAAAIRDDNPVVYLHHYMLTLDTGDVPEGEFVVPFGVADIKRAGSDVTIVATGWMVKKSLAAAEQLASEGIRQACVSRSGSAPIVGCRGDRRRGGGKRF
jgi:pyruvate dehydrogenase E1 component beta subunit